MTDNVVGKKMVAGFLFSGSRVLLVQKTRPAWQDGLWNGVGGVIEKEETPVQAMVREFREETGYASDEMFWEHFCTEVESFNAMVYFYRAVAPLGFHLWPHANDQGEPLAWINVADACSGRQHVIGNLRWLLPLALDPRRFVSPVLVEPVGDIREKPTW